MSWREIPMPPQIEALPRSPRGYPVPHVANWSSEQTAVLRRDPYLTTLGEHGLAIFSSGNQGDGDPILGEMEPARQRRSVLDRRCQVCDDELGERHRREPPFRKPLYLADLRVHGLDDLQSVGADERGQTIRVRGRNVPLILEPWVCESCLSYALAVCPGLAGIRRREGLRILRVYDASCVSVATRISAGPLEGRIGIGYCKLAVTRADELLPHEFLEATGAEVLVR